MSVNWTQDELHRVKRLLMTTPVPADLPRVRAKLRELGVVAINRVHLGRISDPKCNTVERIEIEQWGEHIMQLTTEHLEPTPPDPNKLRRARELALLLADLPESDIEPEDVGHWKPEDMYLWLEDFWNYHYNGAEWTYDG